MLLYKTEFPMGKVKLVYKYVFNRVLSGINSLWER